MSITSSRSKTPRQWTSAKAVDIQKALKEAGITVRSIQEVHKEQVPQPETATAGE
jgi:hypothetical protein